MLMHFEQLLPAEVEGCSLFFKIINFTEIDLTKWG